MMLVVQQALKGVAGPLGPDANVRLPVGKTNGSELAFHHAIKMIQMFAFCLKMCSSKNMFLFKGHRAVEPFYGDQQEVLGGFSP